MFRPVGNRNATLRLSHNFIDEKFSTVEWVGSVLPHQSYPDARHRWTPCESIYVTFVIAPKTISQHHIFPSTLSVQFSQLPFIQFDGHRSGPTTLDGLTDCMYVRTMYATNNVDDALIDCWLCTSVHHRSRRRRRRITRAHREEWVREYWQHTFTLNRHALASFTIWLLINKVCALTL